MGKSCKKIISVIVPIYNVSEYLFQCIDSIVTQTYKELEIILVDDGSTDDSGVICDKYATLDSRIQVIHKENNGLVSARKIGVQCAKGEYVSFVDGDDWIVPDTFQRLLDIGKNADIITFSCIEEYGKYQILKENTIKTGLYDLENKEEKLYKNMLMNDNFFEFGILPHLCDKLIKREILIENQMMVDSLISYGEDVACTFPCIIDADSIYVTNIPLYHYRQRPGSIAKKNDNISKNALTCLYERLKNKFNIENGNKKYLYDQLHYYMWFVLLVKYYPYLHGTSALFPFSKIQEKKKIVIYGAGGFGKAIKKYCDVFKGEDVVGWVDLHYDLYQKQGFDVISIKQIKKLEFDYLVIAVLNEKSAEQIKKDLVNRGISEDKIDWIKRSVLKKEKLPVWLN